jgi:peptidoglycan hydrolase FlgJ
MTAMQALASPSVTAALDTLAASGTTPMVKSAAKPTSDGQVKAHAAAVNFEAQFLNSMFGEMFTAMGDDGPLGDGQGVGVWRSFLTEQYAKSFAKAGGIGLADHVYKALIAQQEARPS